MRVAYLLVAATALVSAAGFAGAEQRHEQITSQQGAETLVEQAQKKLAAMDLKPGPVNGIEHKKTQEAVKRFQKSLKLDVSGRLDTQTLAALGVRPAISVARSAPPSAQLSVVPSESSTIASASMLPSVASSAAQSASLSPPSESSRESSSERMAEPASEQPKS